MFRRGTKTTDGSMTGAGAHQVDEEKMRGLNRRALLGLAAAGGVGAALGAGNPAAAAAAVRGATIGSVPAAPAPAPAPTTAVSLVPFPQQDDLNFQTLFNYGEIAYRSGEAGEVSVAVAAVQAAITAAGTTAIPAYQPYNVTFEALAARTKAEADAELAAGRLTTARDRYLRAAAYYNSVMYFITGGDTPGREGEVYGLMQACWASAAALLEPVFERVEIPAIVRFPNKDGVVSTRSVTLPAYWSRAAGEGRPTVIVNNGSDAQLIDTYSFGGAAGVDRGYNVLMFEGPGQGSLLFEQDIPFTPYWQDVVTPLVDFIVAQPGVDASKIALTGWSFGGALVMRAAAAEPRLAAVVADPAFYDVGAEFDELKNAVIGAFGSFSNENWAELYNYSDVHGPMGQLSLNFLVNKRGEIFSSEIHQLALTKTFNTDIVGMLDLIATYDVTQEQFGAITANALLVRYATDQFAPEDPSPQVAAWLTKAASVERLVLTPEQGADQHCSPAAPQVRNEAVFAWLDRVLAVVPGPTPVPVPIVPPAPPAPPVGPAGGGELAATGASASAAPVAAIATGLATAGAGAAALAARLTRKA
ncbi:alpha/beta fold hydrolase [Herbiconiux sp. CPCC 203407]|uniref:Alpha/beta fold hydrolase n=2 Tax=Herbiconiux oxytropis TaxID=2970915 RepID=A0AA41XFX1_9MICO|nr:prolyl oligopeptidase family serine peptidase [Herbiconiux oxytropis]MCS5727456.1 alpha/beta fold hydrolase [Herbiconiux oxytropis]